MRTTIWNQEHSLLFSKKAAENMIQMKGSINYNKEQDDQNAGTLWVVEFSSSNGGGGCWIQLSLPSLAMPNSATHLRVGVISWSEFNEMEKSGPSNFIHVNPTQTHWTSPLPDFPLQRNIERVAPFFCFMSKGSNQFGTRLGFTLRLTVNVKLGTENFI